MNRETILLLIAFTISLTAACNAQGTPGPSKGGESGEEAVSSAPIPPRTEKPRLVTCRSLGFDGDGEEREARFELVNHAPRAIRAGQSWVYYYGADGEPIDIYPNAFTEEIAAGGSLEIKLGRSGDDIVPGAASAECEISDVTWRDDEKWSNRNLEPFGKNDRPRGGLSDQQLVDFESEKVEAEWTKQGDQTLVKFHNKSGRPLSVRTVSVIQYGDEREVLQLFTVNLGMPLPVDGTQELPVDDPTFTNPPPATKATEAVVAEVDFEDGPKERWQNANLVPKRYIRGL